VRTIHLVRHGRTAANAGGLLLGRLDPDLDAEGEVQAEAAAGVVATTVAPGPVRVVSSPLGRCRATAAVVARALGGDVVVEVDDRWIELDYGDLDGTPFADVTAETWSAWRADVRWRPPGGESLADLGARVRDACEAIRGDADERGDVVVVTHVSPIKAAVAWAIGVGDEVSWRLYVAPGSITRIAVRPGAPPSLHAFNVVP
jgi:broad specificity phosphatase PhoE